MAHSLFDPDNALLVQARSGTRLPPIWVVIPVAFIILLLSQLGAAPVAMFNLMRRTPDLNGLAQGDTEALAPFILPQTALEQVAFLIGSFSGIYILIGLWVWGVEKRSWRSLGLAGGRRLISFGRGFGLGALMFGVVIGLGALFGVYRVELNSDLSGGVALGAVVVLAGWMVQGPAEELLFRGWVLPTLSARYTIWTGVAVSSVMFAIAHALNPGISPLAAFNLLLFGLFTALYTLSEGGVWGVFGIHAVWNWVQGNVFGLEVSGARSPGGSLLVTNITGANLLTGGSFGPEGSIFVTLILGAAIGALWLLNRRAQE